MSRSHTKQTDILINLGSEAELWHTRDARPFATVEMSATRQNLEINSPDFRRWLQRRFWETQDTAASSHSLKGAEDALIGKAVFDGDQQDAFIRLARHDGNIYLDLGSRDRHVVEITSEGWRQILDPPVRFYRSPGLESLPLPETGGSVADLRPFVNVRSDEDFILAVACLLGALSPQGPFPIALIQGEQGSAKSTLTRVLRSLVDPAMLVHCALPTSERGFAISAQNSWIQAFDNLSGIHPWLSDAFCRMATGGGFKTRLLYSNTEEITLQLCRPQILNGIEDLARRDDLRDRGILLELPVISAQRRKRERTLWSEFEEARPRILGALLDAVSTALREESSMHVVELPRMADFAAWVVGAEKSLPWAQGAFLDAYEQNRRDAISLVLDHQSPGPADDPVRRGESSVGRNRHGTAHQDYRNLSRIPTRIARNSCFHVPRVEANCSGPATYGD